MSETAAIILAAGTSSRMGRAKQLLSYKGETMLDRMIRIAKLADLSPIVIVIGARAASIKASLTEKKDIHITLNPDWESGMGSSVACGLTQALEIENNLAQACFLLTDQPYVDVSLIQNIRAVAQAELYLGAVANYGSTLGVPALFKRALFEELLQLRGQKGAKALISRHADVLAQVPFPKGILDLDYPEDWERFLEEE